MNAESSRRAGIIGPAAFVAAWVIAGFATAGYSPVSDAISRLAAVNAPTRALMTFGMCAYGIALPFHGATLRARYGRACGIAGIVSGIATLGVAALPLDSSATVDTAHGVAATIAYIASAAMPYFASRADFGRGDQRSARAHQLAAIVAALSLIATTFGPAHGLYQRLGLGIVDVWLIAGALRRVGPPSEPKPSDSR